MEFIHWLRHSHQRRLELVKGDERKVPLRFHWVGDMLLTEQLEAMAAGDDEVRGGRRPWSSASIAKSAGRWPSRSRARRSSATASRRGWSRSWNGTTGRKAPGRSCKQLLLRGVGVHHAGLLPKYRRIVEELFQRKLLSVAICTETLSAGINLPARSVVCPAS